MQRVLAILSMILSLSLVAPEVVLSAQTLPPTRWVLVYAATPKKQRPLYTVNDFTRLLAVVDTSGHAHAWLNTGAIFLNLYATSGNVFTTWIGGTPATGEDWVEYTDSLFAPGAVLSRLDSAVAIVTRVIGGGPGRLPIAVMVPYPEPREGSIRYLGRDYDLKGTEGRATAVKAYMEHTLERFHGAALPHLRFDGFYWLHETIPLTDTAVVKATAVEAHRLGTRFLWVPYYDAQNFDKWKQLGFDEAWLQPNFFFDRSVPDTRLDSAVAKATRYGLGLEVEFDGRLYVDPQFGDRLDPYLQALSAHPEFLARPIVMYEGGGALLRLSKSSANADRLRYSNLVRVLR